MNHLPHLVWEVEGVLEVQGAHLHLLLEEEVQQGEPVGRAELEGQVVLLEQEEQMVHLWLKTKIKVFANDLSTISTVAVTSVNIRELKQLQQQRKHIF